MASDDLSQSDYFSDDAATFGDRIAAARETIGMDQEDLAKRLGVKLKTVRAWEEDLAEPRANKLQMLSGVLNVSMRWLLTAEGPGVDAPSAELDEADEMPALLAEMRALRSEAAQLGEKLGRLEKRMRAAMRS